MTERTLRENRKGSKVCNRARYTTCWVDGKVKKNKIVIVWHKYRKWSKLPDYGDNCRYDNYRYDKRGKNTERVYRGCLDSIYACLKRTPIGCTNFTEI